VANPSLSPPSIALRKLGVEAIVVIPDDRFFTEPEL
jgi:hypothetical protein